MKSRLLLNLALAAILVALGLFAWLRPGPAPHPEYRLSTQAPDTVRRMTISRSGQPDLVLERTATGWRVTEPVAARANDQTVNGVLRLLSATSRKRFPAADPARFGLDNPILRLTVDGQEFVFGTQQPVSGEQYVAAGGAVYLVSPRYLAAALQPLAQFAETPERPASAGSGP
jgi:hypothetical protein